MVSSAGDKLLVLHFGSLMAFNLQQRNGFEFYYKLLLTDPFDCWGFKEHNQNHCRPYNKQNQHNKGNGVFRKFARAPGDEQLIPSSWAEKHEMNFSLQQTWKTCNKEHVPFYYYLIPGLTRSFNSKEEDPLMEESLKSGVIRRHQLL